MNTFTRAELVIMHTLISVRIGKMMFENAANHPNPTVAQSNRNYLGELRTLQSKVDKAIDESKD